MRRRRGDRAGLVFGLAALAVLFWAPAARSRCLVINQAKTSYTTLQAAQDAASAGDTLLVVGTCVGETRIGKDLTIAAQREAGSVPPRAISRAGGGRCVPGRGRCNRSVPSSGHLNSGSRAPAENGLNGGGSGPVLTIDSGVTVTVDSLTIAGGRAAFGGGVLNHGTLILKDSHISDNRATQLGGGVANNGGALNLDGGSSITDNRAIDGGGVYNTDGGTVTLHDDSKISDNRADQGGGIFNDAGTADLHGFGEICDNAANEGAGVYNRDILNVRGIIDNNHAKVAGGGVFNFTGTLNGTGGGIFENTAPRGGGVYNLSGSVTAGPGLVFIHNNLATRDGGGVYSDFGTVTLLDASEIVNNNALDMGGGVYLSFATLKLNNGSVIGENSARSHGGGVYHENGTIDLSGGSIVDNTPDNIFPPLN